LSDEKHAKTHTCIFANLRIYEYDNTLRKNVKGKNGFFLVAMKKWRERSKLEFLSRYFALFIENIDGNSCHRCNQVGLR